MTQAHITSNPMTLCLRWTKGLALFIALLLPQPSMADSTDTLAIADTLACAPREGKDSARHEVSPYHFKPLQLALPATLIGIGAVGVTSDWIIKRNKEIRNELQENIKRKITIDDYAQYAPMVATYGLKLCGVKSQHGYVDMTILLGTSYALMGISVNTLKRVTHVQRPDGTSRNSFPSGHTATAFMGAELLRREYWDTSPWIGVAGYAVAAGTGFLRMYNNRHWLTDVVAGAGVGILSVEAAYWLYPALSKVFYHKKHSHSVCLSPYFAEGGKGIACQVVF